MILGVADSNSVTRPIFKLSWMFKFSMNLKKLIPIILLTFLAVFILLSLKFSGITKKEFEQITDLKIKSAINPSKTFNAQDFSGDYYVIHIFATWCEACTANSEFFNKIKQETSKKIIGFIVRDNPNNLNEYVKLNNFYDDLIVIHDDCKIKIFKGPIPITLLIDPEGQIKFGHLGSLNNKQTLQIINIINNHL